MMKVNMDADADKSGPATDTEPVKWLPTRIVPPYVPEIGRFDIDRARKLLIYVPPEIVAPWRKKAVDQLKDCADKSDLDGILQILENISLDEGRPKRLAALDTIGNFGESLDDSHVDLNLPMKPNKETLEPISAPNLQLRNNEMRKMKEFIIGLSVEDISKKFEAAEKKNKEKRCHLKKLRDSGLDRMIINAEAAGNPEILKQQHSTWVEEHEYQLERAKANYEDIQKNYIANVEQSTMSHRLLLKKQQAEHRCYTAKQGELLNDVLVATAASMMFAIIKAKWKEVASLQYVRRIAIKWRKQTEHSMQRIESSRVLRKWMMEVDLHRSSHRVRIALRRYIRKVCIIQRHWRRKLTRREGRKQILLRLWEDEEKAIAAKYEEEARRQNTRTRTRKSTVRPSVGTQSTRRQAVRPKKTVEVIPPEIRDAVIHEFVVDAEAKYTKQCHDFDVELWPQLIQIIYETENNISRSRAKEIADKYRQMGLMHVAMHKYPAAEACFDKYPVFSLEVSTIKTLYKTGLQRYREQYKETWEKKSGKKENKDPTKRPE